MIGGWKTEELNAPIGWIIIMNIYEINKRSSRDATFTLTLTLISTVRYHNDPGYAVLKADQTPRAEKSD